MRLIWGFAKKENKLNYKRLRLMIDGFLKTVLTVFTSFLFVWFVVKYLHLRHDGNSSNEI